MEQFRLSVQRNPGLLCLCSTLLYDWSRKLASPSLNQSDAELLPIIAWSSAFSRALGSLIIFIARSHWLSGYFPWVFSWVFFLSRTSRGHNVLPRLGLEPGSSDSEPSALTTGQSRGVGVPAVQLTTHVKSSTLYGRTSKFFRLDGLLLFCIIMGLRSASSAIILWYPMSSANPNSAELNAS